VANPARHRRDGFIFEVAGNERVRLVDARRLIALLFAFGFATALIVRRPSCLQNLYAHHFLRTDALDITVTNYIA
jgi:hypothetical protein